MPIRRNGINLAVDDPHGDASYMIEPARYELGLSRAEMVDHHLADLANRGDAGLWAGHTDALLDARAVFLAQEAQEKEASHG